ncbi:MAG: hypothetical protein IJQ12_02420 [Lachnospiraceae bacterium]|nr:hypothetical protein [Lachnospiraceae bacterium]
MSLLNINKRMCIIRRNAPDAGIGSFIISSLGGIKYCVDNGYIPIIDMQSHKNMYLKKEDVGHVNAWELFFRQPAGYTLDDARITSKVVDGTNYDRPNLSMDFLGDNMKVEQWRNIFKRHVVFQTNIEKIISEICFDACGAVNYNDITGVLCRGTDYSLLRPKSHPIQPNVEETVEIIKKNGWHKGSKKIFIATEDEDVLDRFKSEFQEDLLYINTKRYKMTDKTYLSNLITQSGIPIMNGIYYLASIYVLSECRQRIMGRTSGSVVAYLMSSDEKETIFIDKGTY